MKCKRYPRFSQHMGVVKPSLSQSRSHEDLDQLVELYETEQSPTASPWSSPKQVTILFKFNEQDGTISRIEVLAKVCISAKMVSLSTHEH